MHQNISFVTNRLEGLLVTSSVTNYSIATRAIDNEPPHIADRDAAGI